MVKLLSLIGTLWVSGSSASIVAEQIKVNNVYVEQAFYYQSGPYGLKEEAIETSLITNMIIQLKKFLIENNQELTNINSASIQLTSTAESTNNDGLKLVLINLIEKGGEVISETYKTEHKGQGNYDVYFNLTYRDGNGNIQTYNINSYNSLFNQFQLENGSWRIKLQFDYTEKDINNTENEFISNLELSNYGFMYYVHQVKDMFNNYQPFNNSVIELIQKEQEVNLEEIEAVALYKAISNNDLFELGDKYKYDEIINEDYFYVSFESKDVNGTYNMLIKNVS